MGGLGTVLARSNGVANEIVARCRGQNDEQEVMSQWEATSQLYFYFSGGGGWS